MKPKRIWVLFARETLHGPKGFIFIMAIVMPFLLSLILSLSFGNLFTDKPKLGILDEGQSQLVTLLKDTNTLAIRQYSSLDELKHAAEGGSVDMGIVLPPDFDTALASQHTLKLTAYVWGESPAKYRSLIPASLADAAHTLVGEPVPVDIQTVALGEADSLTWPQRLLPLIVLMAVFFSGLMLPASSLIDEKQKRTLEALNTTPATLGEVFISKGLLGALLSLIMGILILALNQTLGSSTGVLILVLTLGAIMATEIGLILGALIKDMNTLFAVWKFGGLILFAPAIIYMFPQIPQWIGMLFPTYYILEPVMRISRGNTNWSDIAPYVYISVGLLMLLSLLLAAVVRRLGHSALRLTG